MREPNRVCEEERTEGGEKERKRGGPRKGAEEERRRRKRTRNAACTQNEHMKAFLVILSFSLSPSLSTHTGPLALHSFLTCLLAALIRHISRVIPTFRLLP